MQQWGELFRAVFIGIAALVTVTSPGPFTLTAVGVRVTVLVLASLAVGGIIILEAALSFLGLGVQRPTPSWGTRCSSGSSR